MSEKTTGSLSNKVSTSAFWIFLFQIMDNVLGFVRLLILARLLSPSDFGLVAIAWLVLQTIGTFTQTGIHQTLIHKPNVEKYLDTAWTFLLIRGFALYGLVYIFSDVLGSFFNSPDAIGIIKFVSVTMVFDGFVNIGVVLFQKNLTFNKQFIYQLSTNFIDFIVALTMAFVLRDVWALVYGALANSLARIVLSYILSEYRPKFAFDFEAFKEMNNYGKWIAGSNILQFIYSQGDDLLVGKVLGSTALGFYQLAYRISNLPATQITHIISAVLFPAYSKIQNDLKRLSRIYLQVFQLITFLSFFVGSVIICFAHDFTILFLGEKWLPMVPAMQILTLWGVLRSMAATTGPVWQAIGRPHLMTRIQLFQVIILTIIIIPLTLLYGIIGTSLSIVLSALLPYSVAFIHITNTLSLSKSKLFQYIIYPFINSLLICFIYIFLKATFPYTTLFTFTVFSVTISISYLVNTYVFSKYTSYKFVNNLFEYLEILNISENYKEKIRRIKYFLQ